MTLIKNNPHTLTDAETSTPFDYLTDEERKKQARGLEILQYGDKRNNPEALDHLLTDEERAEQDRLNDQQEQEG